MRIGLPNVRGLALLTEEAYSYAIAEPDLLIKIQIKLHDKKFKNNIC